MKTFSMTDTGVWRTMNQDYFFTSETPVGNLPNLFIVSDGMGGHKAGEYASRYTVERVVASSSRNTSKNPVKILREAIEKANEILVMEAGADESKQGMGTTIVAATIAKGKMCIANVGDSRLYVIGDTIEQITKDHSYVAEMVRQGKVDPKNASMHPDKNIITRAVGASDTIQTDFFEVDVKEGDTILLCSDGLTNMVTDDEICRIIREVSDLSEAGKTLVSEANKNGGSDNITVVLVKPDLDEVKEC
jgi:protein phosphatase